MAFTIKVYHFISPKIHNNGKLLSISSGKLINCFYLFGFNMQNTYFYVLI